MQDLSTLRSRWTEIEKEETRLLRKMTIAESLRAFAMLYEAFAARFREDELAYQAEREAALIEQQCRLRRLADWIKDHPDTQAVGA
jgi:hypothetical protein